MKTCILPDAAERLVGRMVVLAAWLAALCWGAWPVRKAQGQNGYISFSSGNGLQMLVDMSWTDGAGYRPIMVEVTAPGTPAAVDRQFSVRLIGRYRYMPASPAMAVTEHFVIPAGSNQARAVLTVPTYFIWNQLDVELYEDGEYLDRVSQRDVFFGMQSFAWDLGRPRILVATSNSAWGPLPSVLLERGPSRVSPFLVPKMIVDSSAGDVSIYAGSKGPNYSITTACATGSHCIGAAFRHIRNDECDVMITGGCEAPLTDLGFAGFNSIKALSTRNDDPGRACRPFDADRDGFIMAEGAGILILEELEHARRRGAIIHGEVIGFGCTGDAHHETAPDPEGAAGAMAMQLALRDGHIAPDQVGYFNAHGTSTKFNDKTETAIIKKVFGDHARKLAISSTKSMTGHTLGAAGGIEAIATILALRDGILPPTINYETPDPDCDLDYIPNTARPAQVAYALSNNLGFGGHNACVAFRRFQG
mgnify:CR=1 FL=1